ncbi:MAG TPA: PAS domain S-box protein, partial [Solirubrobacteraceae bacterium]|nr:PAS domain S-box protein [Solirubrobacteraceae bacterium]
MDARPDRNAQRFADVEQLAHVGWWEREMSARSAVWSDELCRIFGVPPEFSPGLEEFLGLVHPDDRAAVTEHLRRARDGERGEAVYRIVRPDGSVRRVESRVHGRRDADGAVACVFGTIQDVTARHELERERREVQEMFEASFAHAPVGMALLGLDGSWLKVNAAACAISGRTEEELLACSYREITHPDDRDLDQVQIEMLLEGEISGYQIERRYLTPAGEVVWALVSVSLVRDGNGAPQHFICQIEDISARKL